MNEETFDVGIIGAGMLGSAAAYHLAQAGQRVIVLDAGAATAGTTSNSFSWVNAVAKEPETYHALNFAGQREYDRLAADVPAIELHRGGCIQWEADPDSQAALEARVARLQARGYGARWIDPAELAALEPRIRPGEASRFAYYERDLWVDAPAVARSLLTSVRERGGEVRERCRVTGFDGRDARVTRIVTDQGSVAVGAVLVAGGIGTRALVRDLGADIPVNRSPGLLAVTTPVPAGTLSRVLYPPGFHVRPDVSGGLRVGADDIDALTKEDTPPGPPPAWAQPLLDRTAAVLTLPAGVRIDHIRVGVRPVPADGHTVAGRIPGSDNAYVVVTHSAITMGPLLGRLIAEEITTGARDPLLRDFRPERFSAGRTPRPV